MSNKDLLKQAIAEAKTIREAAIANAKEALEETLTPHLKSMLAAKLQEMDNDDDEVPANPEDYTKQPGYVHEAEDEDTDADAEVEETEEELEIEDMSVEDLKDMIRDIVAQETGAAEGEYGAEDMEGAEMEAGDGEEIDINEILSELSEMEEEEDVNENILATAKAAAQKAGMSLEKWIDSVGDKLRAAGIEPVHQQKKNFEESVDVNENIFATAKAAAEKAGMSLEKWIDKVGDKLRAAGIEPVHQQKKNFEESVDVNENILTMAKQAAEKAGMSLEKWIDSVGDKLRAAGIEPVHQQKKNFEESTKAELEEALTTIETLKSQLQEVNLLNAKLLYVNKVFKSNNLSESQKVNVITAFDKAETVREVKLVFETVSKNVVAQKAAPIKEHVSFASKATGKTASNREVISEVSDQVRRMQKLAGIIK